MIRINDFKAKTTLKAAVLASVLVLFAAAPGFSQQVVNLTAGPATAALPDGTVVPMWGYACGAAVTGATATCAPLTGLTSQAAIGALGGIYVVNGGSGYTSSPAVTITPAAGNTPTATASATAVVSGGVVVGFNVISHGAGYTAAPTVTIAGPGHRNHSCCGGITSLVPCRDNGSLWSGGRPSDQPDQQPLVYHSWRNAEQHSHIYRDYGASGRWPWRVADHHAESRPHRRAGVRHLVYRLWGHPAGYPMHVPASWRFRHASDPRAARAIHVHGSGGRCAGNSYIDATNLGESQAGYIYASIRHPSFNSGTHGLDWHAGGHHRAYARYNVRGCCGRHSVPCGRRWQDCGDSGGDVQRGSPTRVQ